MWVHLHPSEGSQRAQRCRQRVGLLCQGASLVQRDVVALLGHQQQTHSAGAGVTAQSGLGRGDALWGNSVQQGRVKDFPRKGKYKFLTSHDLICDAA